MKSTKSSRGKRRKNLPVEENIVELKQNTRDSIQRQVVNEAVMKSAALCCAVGGYILLDENVELIH